MGEKQMGEEDERKMEEEDGREAYGRGSGSLLLGEKRQFATRSGEKRQSAARREAALRLERSAVPHGERGGCKKVGILG